MLAARLGGPADGGGKATRLPETPLGEFSSDTLATALSGLPDLAAEVRSQTREARFTFARADGLDPG